MKQTEKKQMRRLERSEMKNLKGGVFAPGEKKCGDSCQPVPGACPSNCGCTRIGEYYKCNEGSIEV